MTLRTKLELQCKETEESVKTGEANLVKNKIELEELTLKIAEAKEKLQKQVQPKFEEAKDDLTRMSIERNDAKKKMDGLYAKQGRGRQFESQEARDDYLQVQIEELNGAKEEKKTLLNEKRDSLANLRRSTTSTVSESEKKKADLAKNERMLDSLNQSITEKKRERHEMAEKRKVQWGSLSELSAKVSDARESARRAYSSLRKIMPRNTAMGLDALGRIIKEEGIVIGEQYFGPVMENIDLVDEKFQTAVEIAAQNALFHVIVDTDATAARLMKRLERERLGRVTFLPLNQLHTPETKYPESRDVVPLLRTCIRFDSKLRRAMDHVFGKKLLANSVEVASTWSSRCKMDAVTLDGDLCSRNGALSGGFVDRNKRLVDALNDLYSPFVASIVKLTCVL
jgi:structural maintenance of chromosome 3 (chondroitin sulfate proteoglycan 6)